MTDIVASDIPCAWCGYNLRTLPVDARCPECGKPVAKSTLPFPKAPQAAAALRRVGRAPLVNFVALVIVLAAALRETVVFRGTITKFTPEAVVVLVGASELWACLSMLAASLALFRAIPASAGDPVFAGLKLLRRAAAVRAVGTVLLIANMLWLAKVSGGRTIAGWHVALPLFGLVQGLVLAWLTSKLAGRAGRADLGSRLMWIARLEAILLIALMIAATLLLMSGGGLFDIFTHAREIVAGSALTLLLPLVAMAFALRELADAVTAGPRSLAQVQLRRAIHDDAVAALAARVEPASRRPARPARPNRLSGPDAIRLLQRTPRRLLGEPLTAHARRAPRRLLGRW